MVDKREKGRKEAATGTRVVFVVSAVVLRCGVVAVWPTLRLVIAALIAGTLHSAHHG